MGPLDRRDIGDHTVGAGSGGVGGYNGHTGPHRRGMTFKGQIKR